MANSDEHARASWARMTAYHLVDGALAASERPGGSHASPDPLPSPDQVALLREIALRALWRMPSSDEELKKLRDAIENLRHPDDNEPPWP